MTSKASMVLTVGLSVGLSVIATRWVSVEPARAQAGLPEVLCARSIRDQATGDCMLASSVPELGKLYPNSENLYVDPSGNVGVGTTIPAARLHVAGDLKVDGLQHDGGVVAGYLDSPAWSYSTTSLSWVELWSGSIEVPRDSVAILAITGSSVAKSNGQCWVAASVDGVPLAENPATAPPGFQTWGPCTFTSGPCPNGPSRVPIAYSATIELTAGTHTLGVVAAYNGNCGPSCFTDVSGTRIHYTLIPK